MFGAQLYFEKIKNDVNGKVVENEYEISKSEAFLKICYDHITDIVEQNELVVCRFEDETNNTRIDGYDLLDETKLVLYICDYFDNSLKHISENENINLFNKVENFINISKDNSYYKSLVSNSEEYEISKLIYNSFSMIKKIDIVVISNGLLVNKKDYSTSIDDVEINIKNIDINEMLELGCFDENQNKKVSIDILTKYKEGIDCIKCDLGCETNNYKFDTYLFFIKGTILAELYDEHRYNLLEGNVRGFLKKTGKTNSGVYETIIERPDHFVAFNNGLSTVASGIEIIGNRITRIEDWQIVNGGQTTATLHAAFLSKKNIENIRIPVKLTIVRECDDEQKSTLITDISKCANTQNKVEDTDFISNDWFNKSFEKLSRKVCIPSVVKGNEFSKWYFERIKGQYSLDEAKSNPKTFKYEYPKENKVDKELLAKAVMSFEQEPYTVSLGKQKNTITYNSRVKANEGQFVVNETYYKRSMATVILFNEVGKIVKEEKFGGYNANIQTYTIALLSFLSGKRLNLDKIWEEQGLNLEFKQIIKYLAIEVQQIITNTPDTDKNVAMFCRKEQCWTNVRGHKYEIEIPSDYISDIVFDLAKQTNDISIGDEILSIDSIESAVWGKLSSWGRETEKLTGAERKFAYQVMRYKAGGLELSSKQVNFAKSIYIKAKKYGFEE